MNADSVKAKLKNFAIGNNITFQEALVYYGLERTVYRISIFGEEFINDPMHLTRWNAFLKKKKAIIQVSLPDVMAQIKNLYIR